MSQLPSKLETGVPHVVGVGAPFVMSDGIEPREKNQTLMKAVVHCTAYTPPPLELN